MSARHIMLAALLAAGVTAPARAVKPDSLWTVRIAKGEVDAVAFSPDGQTLAAGEQCCSDSLPKDGVKLWRASDGTMLRSLKLAEPIWSVAFSPDGQIVASGGLAPDDTAKLWRVSDGALLHTFQHGNSVVAIAFSPDGQIVATNGFDGAIVFWRVSDGKRLMSLSPGGEIEAFAFSPGGRFFAYSTTSGTLGLAWNPFAPGRKAGDVDGDGLVSVKDATLALGFAVGAGSPTPDQLQAADMDGDGSVTARDVVLILRYAVRPA